MPAPIIAAVAAPFAGALAGKVLGGGGAKNAEAAVPKDVKGTRKNLLDLQNWLLGFGGPPAGLALGGAQQRPALPYADSGFANVIRAFGGNWDPIGGFLGSIPNAIQPPPQAINPPRSDTVPAMLSPGEYVLPPEMVNYLGGAHQLEGIRQFMMGGPVDHYATGGPVLQQPTPGVSFPTTPGGFDPVQGMGGPQIMPNPNPGQMVNFGSPGNASALPAANNPGAVGDRFAQYFGTLGVPFSGLQNTAAQSANRMLTQQSPEQRALEATGNALTPQGINPQSQNFLQNVLSGNQGFLGGLANIAQTGGLPTTGFGKSILDQLQQVASGSLGGGGGSAADPFLSNLLKENPGATLQQYLQPAFERNLALANQQGGRFGTANALLRSNAVTDQQSQLANLLQQGTNQQIQAASTLGQLANASRANELQARLGALGLGTNLVGQAGQNQLGALGQIGGFQTGAANSLGQLGLSGLGLYGNLANQAGAGQRADIVNAANIGAQQAGQNDVENQRRINLILGILGQAGGSAFNQPTVVQPSGAQQGAGIGAGIANTLTSALPYILGGGGGGGAPGEGPAGTKR